VKAPQRTDCSEGTPTGGTACPLAENVTQLQEMKAPRNCFKAQIRRLLHCCVKETQAWSDQSSTSYPPLAPT